MFWRKTDANEARITATVIRVVKDVFKQVDDELAKIHSMSDLVAKIRELREQVSALEIDKSKKEEAYARKERELEHKVGLHKTQVAQDIALAKREATVKIQEENLAVDRKRFEEQMKFVTENFDKQTGYLTEIIGDLSKRLPSLAMTADVGKHQTRVR